jgi:hypothetical protein
LQYSRIRNQVLEPAGILVRKFTVELRKTLQPVELYWNEPISATLLFVDVLPFSKHR